MSHKAVVLRFLAVLVAGTAAAQSGGQFYNVDKEVRIDGTVREIILEPRRNRR